MTLTVSGLTYHFSDTGRGCTNVSFVAELGRLTVVKAPSGAGKSTALAGDRWVIDPAGR